MRTKNPFNNKGASWEAWQTGYDSLETEVTPYSPEAQDLTEFYNKGRATRAIDDVFNESHELEEFSTIKVVDFCSNQEIETVEIGDVKKFKRSGLQNLCDDKFNWLIKNTKADYVYYFKHYGKSFMIEGHREIGPCDLIRVDFVNREMIIEKNFFKRKNGN